MSLTVGIAGIAGKFARELVSALLKYPNVAMKGYCRDPSKVPAALSTRVSLTQGDAFDEAAVGRFVSGCDVVVCCYLGDDKVMTERQTRLVDACAEAGVPRYVASDCKQMHELRKNQPEKLFAYIILFYEYYMFNGQILLGPETDNHKYPQVKPVSWEDFFRRVPMDHLSSAYSGVGQGAGEN
ncbi:hypothetical protein GGS23DRAFT_555735 [Durotheca rogersii]|uniref:uncharacterized protein n=1 Tax=Durotheca rogersii TaxID=419775 RepID=UPI0022201D74|nr:uncharacterized protein GGS23DRAFT_555735 [Durotheca rogersii]KAI5866148.1 hypothetical protein GGS23DRAFT_555735 [Durotheca rogersii]